MFEQAARLKLRFQSMQGYLSSEDLFDLAPIQLDGIFKILNAQAKTQTEESLLDTVSEEDEIVNLKISVVKHIVTTKLQEQTDRELAVANQARKEKLLTILAEKQDAELHDLDVGELEKLIDGFSTSIPPSTI